MKAMVLALGLAAVLAAIIGLSLAASPGGAQAQGGIAAPGNVRALDGTEVGQAAQLDVIRHDLDGDGETVHGDYAAAFPDAIIS